MNTNYNFMPDIRMKMFFIVVLKLNYVIWTSYPQKVTWLNVILQFKLFFHQQKTFRTFLTNLHIDLLLYSAANNKITEL